MGGGGWGGAGGGGAVDLRAVGWRWGCGCGEVPEVDVTLEGGVLENGSAEDGARWDLTLLFAAAIRLPSPATLMLLTLQPGSGTNSCVHLFSPRSHILTLPPRSAEMISP